MHGGCRIWCFFIDKNVFNSNNSPGEVSLVLTTSICGKGHRSPLDHFSLKRLPFLDTPGKKKSDRKTNSLNNQVPQYLNIALPGKTWRIVAGFMLIIYKSIGSTLGLFVCLFVYFRVYQISKIQIHFQTGNTTVQPQDNQDFPEQSLKYTSTQISVRDLLIFFAFHLHIFIRQNTDRRRLQ